MLKYKLMLALLGGKSVGCEIGQDDCLLDHKANCIYYIHILIDYDC